jgi:choline monooxygenase
MSDRVRTELFSFDPTTPLERARSIPNTWYTDPDIYELERQSVFGGNWLMAGRLDQVATPGSFLTAEIAGEPILVVRDAEGTLRAFFNVCRHRAAPILTEPCGSVTKLRCRYHGWTYDLAGRLRGTPEFDGVAEFHKEEQGLPEVPVATWGPLVWVHLGEPAQTLEQFLEPLPAWVAGRGGIDKLQFVRRQEYDLKCNWKVYVDNYLDGGYHVNTVHPGLAGVLDYREYTTAVHGFTSLQSSPIKAPDDDDQTKRTRTGDLAAYWWIYPNFMVNLYEGVMDTNLVLPLGPDRCRVVFDFYFAEPTGTERERFMRESMAVAHRIQEEDMGICEEVQRGLTSRSYRCGRFSVKREVAGYCFHQLLGRQLQAAVGP